MKSLKPLKPRGPSLLREGKLKVNAAAYKTHTNRRSSMQGKPKTLIFTSMQVPFDCGRGTSSTYFKTTYHKNKLKEVHTRKKMFFKIVPPIYVQSNLHDTLMPTASPS